MRRWMIGVAVLTSVLACGESQQVNLVLYDSETGEPAPAPRQIDGSTTSWHEHRLQVGPRGHEVPMLVRWETVRRDGCDRVLRVRAERTGGSPGTNLVVRRSERPSRSPECVTLLNGPPDQVPYEQEMVKVDWTGRSGCRGYESRGHAIVVEGSGRVDGTDQILD